MEFEDLADLLIHLILAKLDPRDIARVACVSTRLRVCASDESLWSLHCSLDLSLSAPLDQFGSPLPSYMVTYQVWRQAFSMYSWFLVKRVIKSWTRLRSWLGTNCPLMLDTLRKGVTEDQLNAFEDGLGVKLPVPSRVLYRICDGQEVQRKGLHGLIGGYCFYDQLVNVCLLSLEGIRRQTEQLRRLVDSPLISNHVVVAMSPFIPKVFLLNCSDGQLYVGTRNLFDNGEMMPCVPTTLLSPVGSCDNDKVQDGLLLWFEEHVRRLESGIIGLRELNEVDSINQFPELPPLCTTAVTHGVQVRASAAFIPEMSDLQDPEKKYVFAYSIRMSLLPEGCTVHGTRHSSCQLYWRHWIIRVNENVVKDANGEAVIGKYPLLAAGGEEFVYESCSIQRSVPSSIEGSFTFVPGCLSDPRGDQFEVEVARFPLDLPEYIF